MRLAELALAARFVATEPGKLGALDVEERGEAGATRRLDPVGGIRQGGVDRGSGTSGLAEGADPRQVRVDLPCAGAEPPAESDRFVGYVPRRRGIAETEMNASHRGEGEALEQAEVPLAADAERVIQSIPRDLPLAVHDIRDAPHGVCRELHERVCASFDTTHRFPPVSQRGTSIPDEVAARDMPDMRNVQRHQLLRLAGAFHHVVELLLRLPRAAGPDQRERAIGRKHEMRIDAE